MTTPGVRPPRIAYLAGWGRSGSTLLGRMLGSLPSAIFVGETRDVWQKGGVQDRTCGCGMRFSQCPFWTAVGQHAFGGWRLVDFDEMLHLRAVTDRPWSLPLTGAPSVSQRYRTMRDRYVDALGRLFYAFRAVSGADFVVDSSKMSSFALLLAQIPGSDVRVVHLVRDSRGIAYSWAKHIPRRDRPDSTAQMLRYRPVVSAARYSIYNLQAQLLRAYGLPYLRVRYEQLVREPSLHVRRIAHHCDAPITGDPLSFLSGNSVVLGQHHAVAANPRRHDTGSIALRVDDEWRTAMVPTTRLAVTAVTAPLLIAYGYPLFPSSREPL
jgi:hypothetical protein